MILLIDNYDSFTYNVYQCLAMLGAEVEVLRNDELTVEEVHARAPSGIVISPGPGNPSQAGVSCDVVRTVGQEVPTLGVCLGHQCIGTAFGGRVGLAPQLMHGKTSPIYHQEAGVLAGLPSPFDAVRYHSLAVERDSLPACLEVTAESADGTIMGMRHRDYPIEGVQFHPESVLTAQGPSLLKNFLKRCV
jgi:anthranilate synthase/aminodeoxychorismate synthase-like glutamine amidotransferase